MSVWPIGPPAAGERVKRNFHYRDRRTCIKLYGPEAYLMHLADRCRFLNCSARMGGWGVEGFVMNLQATSGGRDGGGGAVRYEFITYRSIPPPLYMGLDVWIWWQWQR